MLNTAEIVKKKKRIWNSCGVCGVINSVKGSSMTITVNGR